MLRLLKDGTYQSRRKLASVLGYSERQLGRWFDAYRSGGLEALLNRDAPGGRSAKATPEAWAGLVEEMKAGQVARPEDAGRYLSEEHGIEYAGVSSISALFKRRGVKLNLAGRRKNRKADPARGSALPENEFARTAQERPKTRFFAMDEARFGLKAWHRRRWCPSGHRPPWRVGDLLGVDVALARRWSRPPERASA